MRLRGRPCYLYRAIGADGNPVGSLLSEHRSSQHLSNRLEPDHRGIRQRYHPLRGFGSVTSAFRFCSAVDALRDHVRTRRTMGEVVPLAERRAETELQPICIA